MAEKDDKHARCRAECMMCWQALLMELLLCDSADIGKRALRNRWTAWRTKSMAVIERAAAIGRVRAYGSW